MLSETSRRTHGPALETNVYTANHLSAHRGLWAGGGGWGEVSGKASQNRTFKPHMMAACPESRNKIKEGDAPK